MSGLTRERPRSWSDCMRDRATSHRSRRCSTPRSRSLPTSRSSRTPRKKSGVTWTCECRRPP